MLKKAANFLKLGVIFAGKAGKNLALMLKYIFSGHCNYQVFLQESKTLIFNCISPIFMIAIALGIVMAVQLGPEFVSRGLANQLGLLTSITMTRELIPVVGALMIATQYGTGIAAEIANMKITEQVDALMVLKVDPIYYLAVPRFLAAICFTPLVIFLGDLVAILASFTTLRLREDIRLTGLLNNIQNYFEMDDIWFCLLKSSIFGAVIVLTAITIGLDVKGGAKEVGKATTSTVILSFIFVVFIDYIITSIYL